MLYRCGLVPKLTWSHNYIFIQSVSWVSNDLGKQNSLTFPEFLRQNSLNFFKNLKYSNLLTSTGLALGEHYFVYAFWELTTFNPCKHLTDRLKDAYRTHKQTHRKYKSQCCIVNLKVLTFSPPPFMT